MDQTGKFLLPSPVFDKKINAITSSKLPYLTPSGMTLSRENQPPTFPNKHMYKYQPKSSHEKSAEEAQLKEHCEACDMDVEHMQQHVAQHEACPVDNCNFRGHFSIMDKHVVNLHSSGLFEKVKKLSTPEEIEAWRAERRKKFPTISNVMLKQAAKEERMQRGERLESNKHRFGRREDRKRPAEPNRNKKKVKNVQNDKHVAKEQEVEPKVRIIAVNEQDRNSMPRFRGTNKMIDYEHATITTPTAKVVSNALQLVECYTSEDEENNETENTTALTTNLAIGKEDMHNNETENTIKQATHLVTDREINCHSSDEGPEEAAIARVATEQPIPTIKVSENTAKDVKPADIASTTKTVKVKKKYQRKSGLNYSKLHQRRQHTMLEKLLENDIRHERNVLLQCVRYVVDNKFFGIGQNI